MALHSNIIVFMMIVTFTCACMIINCPRGGKRSGVERNEILPIRNCARCGPNNTGHCYGPSICCAEEFGCLLGSPESKPCEDEALSPDPCVDTGLGPKCFGGQGFCATSNLCCTQVSCHTDPSCQFAAVGHKMAGPSDMALPSHRSYVFSLLNALAKNQEHINSENNAE